jgi:hypothetical protein
MSQHKHPFYQVFDFVLFKKKHNVYNNESLVAAHII